MKDGPEQMIDWSVRGKRWSNPKNDPEMEKPDEISCRPFRNSDISLSRLMNLKRASALPLEINVLKVDRKLLNISEILITRKYLVLELFISVEYLKIS